MTNTTDTKKTILLIEDDQNLRELYQKVLTIAGYDVSVATDGQEGLLKLQQGGFQLVLLDMMLPKMNGIEVLKKLKAHPAKVQNQKIVLMSNLSEDGVLKEAEELGAASHIVKSEITPGILLEHVKTLIS